VPGGRHYLDHASTSPTRPEAVDAMLPWLAATADPGRVHSEGRAARVAVEQAREQVAALLGARPREVVFTSGATEAINAAVFGATHARGTRVVAARVEHSAVLRASERHEVSWVGVDRAGAIDVDAVRDALRRDGGVALVHVQWANHEVGTLQPVADVIATAHEAGALVHVDAAQAAGHVAIAFDDLGADLLSVSAHKFGGPLGAGALLVRRGLRVEPMLVGADQERARRAGLENVPALVGFGAAAALLADGARLSAEAAAARARTARLLDAATSVDGVSVYGDPEARVPHVVCVGVDGVEAEAVVLALDQAGIAVHSGSACSSESLEPSPVLEAMGVDADRSLRLSVGWSTTDDDIAAFAAAFAGAVARLRSLRA
jgi:cysteine desulfurase